MGFKKFKFKDICDISSSKRIYLSEYVEKGIPFYRGKEISELSDNKEISNQLFISNEKYNEIRDKYGVPQKDDILLTAVGTIGNVWSVDNRKFYFKDGNLLWLKKFNKNTLNPKYLLQYMTSNQFQNEILIKAIGSSQKALTIKDLKQFEIVIPSLTIQNKIVKIFGYVGKYS